MKLLEANSIDKYVDMEDEEYKDIRFVTIVAKGDRILRTIVKILPLTLVDEESLSAGTVKFKSDDQI